GAAVGGVGEERWPPGRRRAGVALLFGLAPSGVYLAGRSPGRRWALTPPFHPCRLSPAVSFLWHFPSGHPDWVLPSALLCGARTFLPAPHGTERPPVRLGPGAILPRIGAQRTASSIARLASASAPRLRSRGTYRTLTWGND